MVRMVDEALDGIAVYRKRYQSLQEISTSALRILECFKESPEIRLSTKQIVEITELSPRMVNYGTLTLIKHDLLQKYGSGPETKYQLTF